MLTNQGFMHNEGKRMPDMRHRMITFPNQKVIQICSAIHDADHLYATISIDGLCQAARELGANGYVLYTYLATNQDGYRFALSQKDVEASMGLSKGQYHKAVNVLIKKGVLQSLSENGRDYAFYECPDRWKPLVISEVPAADTEVTSSHPGASTTPPGTTSTAEMQGYNVPPTGDNVLSVGGDIPSIKDNIPYTGDDISTAEREIVQRTQEIQEIQKPQINTAGIINPSHLGMELGYYSIRPEDVEIFDYMPSEGEDPNLPRYMPEPEDEWGDNLPF